MFKIRRIEMFKGNIDFKYACIPIMFILAMFTLFYFYTDEAFANPARPGDLTTTQPNGNTLKYEMVGDEFFHYFLDSSGNVIQQDPRSGFWKQVVKEDGELALGAKAKTKATDAPANALDPSALEKPKMQEAYNDLADSGVSSLDQTSNDTVTLESLEETNSSDFYTSETTADTSVPLLTIVIGFNDAPYSDTYDWGKTLYTGDRSIGKYYETVSGGKFTVSPCKETSAYTEGSGTNNGSPNSDISALGEDVQTETGDKIESEDPNNSVSGEASPVIEAEANDTSEGVSADEIGNATEGDSVSEGDNAAEGSSVSEGDSEGDILEAESGAQEYTNTNEPDEEDDGVVHIKLDSNHGKTWYDLQDESFIPVFTEALKASDRFVNFSDYDKAPADGVLTAKELSVFFIVAGYETSYGYYDTDLSIWAHQWSFSHGSSSKPPVTLEDDSTNPVTIDPYICMGESVTDNTTLSSYAETNKRAMAIGATVHEFGHILGLPDLYDIDYSTKGEWVDYSVDCMSIMAAGSWGYDPKATDETKYAGSCPVLMDPYCKMLLEFIDPDLITSDNINQTGVYTVTTSGDNSGYKCYVIPTEHEDEIFIVENRQYQGFDVGLKRRYIDNDYRDSYNDAGGIVLWHIDKGIVRSLGISEGSNGSNSINTVDHRPGMMPAYYEKAERYTLIPQIYYPFFNSYAKSRYANYAFNTDLYNGDKRSDRSYSGITVEPVVSLSESGDSLNVKVNINPAAPYAVTAKSERTGTITLNWGEVSSADQYDIYRYNINTDNYKKIGCTMENTYTDTGLTGGTEYSYCIKTIGKSGDSSKSFSNDVSALAAIDAPKNLSAGVTGKSVKLNWSKVNYAKAYDIYRSTSSGGAYSLVYSGSTSSTPETSYTDTVPKSGLIYYYKVVACGEDGNSDYSAAVSANVKISVTLNKLTKGKRYVKAYYSIDGTAAGVKISYRQKGSSKWKSLTTTNKSSKKIKHLRKGKKYYVKVQAYYYNSDQKKVYGNYSNQLRSSKVR